MTGLNWMDYANCLGTDPEAFFPTPGDNANQARQVCYRCPVRHDCLEYALDNNLTDGIFGGLSPRQRQQLNQQHAA